MFRFPQHLRQIPFPSLIEDGNAVVDDIEGEKTVNVLKRAVVITAVGIFGLAACGDDTKSPAPGATNPAPVGTAAMTDNTTAMTDNTTAMVDNTTAMVDQSPSTTGG
jgi:hypothetical protein